MMNEEAVKQLQYIRRNLDEYIEEERINAVNYSISIIQENAKLKAEIEQLKMESCELETQFNILMNKCNILEWNNSKFEITIAELKSELEQSVKEKSEVISKIEYALNECEPVYNKCAVVPQAKPIYDLAMNYCLDLMKGAINE